MDPPHSSDLKEQILEARRHRACVEETLARLKALETEVTELIHLIRWQMYLGYDKASVEFVKRLDKRFPSNVPPRQ